MNYIPPPYPSPYMWNSIRDSRWLTPNYPFLNVHNQPSYHASSVQPISRKESTRQDSTAKPVGLAVNTSWLSTFREKKREIGDPDILEEQNKLLEYEQYKKLKFKAKMKLKKKKRPRFRGKKWYENYIPKDQKYVGDKVLGNSDKTMSVLDHKIALAEATLDEDYNGELKKHPDAEFWPATPLRFV